MKLKIICVQLEITPGRPDVNYKKIIHSIGYSLLTVLISGQLIGLVQRLPLPWYRAQPETME